MNYLLPIRTFFHKSLIHDRIFSNRDFLCVEEMNEQIMDAWNEVVCDQDTVYHLGDIALVDGKTKAYEKVDQLLKSLNGQIVFVKGNHDSRAMFKYLEKHNATLQNARKKYLFNDVGLILKFDKKQVFFDALSADCRKQRKSHKSSRTHSPKHRQLIDVPKRWHRLA